eukprot:6702654-Pyramimonas_sp.AAC.1
MTNELNTGPIFGKADPQPLLAPPAYNNTICFTVPTKQSAKKALLNDATSLTSEERRRFSSHLRLVETSRVPTLIWACATRLLKNLRISSNKSALHHLTSSPTLSSRTEVAGNSPTPRRPRKAGPPSCPARGHVPCRPPLGLKKYGETQGKGFICWRFINDFGGPQAAATGGVPKSFGEGGEGSAEGARAVAGAGFSNENTANQSQAILFDDDRGVAEDEGCI